MSKDGIAESSSTCFSYLIESECNVEETGPGGKTIRRATATLNLAKDEVRSQEQRKDFQEVNVNHGVRSCNWSVNGELHGGDYQDFFAALLRRDFTPMPAVTASAGDGFSILGGVLTRANAANNFIDEGVRIGQIRRLSGMAVTANNDRNIRIVGMTPTTLDLVAVDGDDPIADDAGPNEAASLRLPGQVTFIPSTGHTSKTFTIERHDEKTKTSHVGRGCKVGVCELAVQPNSVPTVTFSGLGVDRRNESIAAPVMPNPTPVTDGLTMSGAIGFARIDGNAVAVITDLSLSFNSGLNTIPVAFTNSSSDVFFGRALELSGTVSVLKESLALSDIFDQEKEVAVDLFIEAPGLSPRQFQSIFIPRVKLYSDDETDPATAVVQTANFRAIKPISGEGLELSTVMIQDSSIS